MPQRSSFLPRVSGGAHRRPGLLSGGPSGPPFFARRARQSGLALILLLASIGLCLLPSIFGDDELPRLVELGVALRPPDAEHPGALVTRVPPGSILGEHGVRPGDRIVRIDGVLLDDPTSLRAALQALDRSARTELIIVRGVETLQCTVALPALSRERIGPSGPRFRR